MRLGHLWAFVLCLAVLMPTMVTAAPDDGRREALLFANSRYPDADTPLRSASLDARALQGALQRQGFAVDLQENATSDMMRDAISRLISKTGKGSVALIYFKGYAIQAYHQTYMIPLDAQIWSDAEVKRDGFGIDDLLSQVSRNGTRVKIAILDAAYSNPFEHRYRKISQGLSPISASEGTPAIYSAALGRLVEDQRAGVSLFAERLIEQLGVAGASGEDVFNQTRLAVSTSSKGEQVPWMSSSMGAGFSFDRSRTPPPVKPSEPASATPSCEGQAGPVLFNDSFRDGTGRWDLRAGVVRLDPSALTVTLGKRIRAFSVQTTAVPSSDGDYCLLVSLPSTSDLETRAAMGIEFFASSYQRFYVLSVFSDRTVGLYRHDDRGWTTIFEVPGPATLVGPDRTNAIRVVINKGIIAAHIDGRYVRDAELAQPPGPLRFGIYAQLGQQIRRDVSFKASAFKVTTGE